MDCEAADYSLVVAGDKMYIQDPQSQGESKGVLDLLPLPGEHNRHNFLGAVAIAREFGHGLE